MSTENANVIESIHEAISALHSAEQTVVEVANRLADHNCDPNAHPLLLSNNPDLLDIELQFVRLANQFVILTDRVTKAELGAIDQNDIISDLQSKVSILTETNNQQNTNISLLQSQVVSLSSRLEELESS